MKKIRCKIDGVILLDKAVGISSNSAIQQVKRLLNAEKVGHTGTLDPEASGLLPICLGEATKFASFLLEGDKEYLATAQLGLITDSGDAEGNIVETRMVKVNTVQIEAALEKFTTSYLQVPPMYSALKYNGKPLYEYARNCIEIERAGRMVTVYSTELLEYNSKLEQVTFCVKVSKGTYIRTLAEDIGNFLGCGASLINLRRIATNHFNIANTVTLSQLEDIADKQTGLPILPCEVLTTELPELVISPDDYQIVKHGNILKLSAETNLGFESTLVSLRANGRFIGVAEINPSLRELRPKRMFSGLAGINPWS